MKINPLLTSDGSPERRQGEAFIWDCSFIRFQYTIKDRDGFTKQEYFGFGQVYVSLFRMVFIWKPPCRRLQALELDLGRMFQENVHQALFGPPVFRAKVAEQSNDVGVLEFSCFHTQDEGKTFQVIMYLLELARSCSWKWQEEETGTSHSSASANDTICLALMDPHNPQLIYLFRH